MYKKGGKFKFNRVVTPPSKQPNHNTARAEALKSYYSKLMHHQSFMKAMGLSPKMWKVGMRICSQHGKIKKKAMKKIVRQYKNGTSKEISFDFEYFIPKSEGMKHTYKQELDEGRRTSTAKDRSHIRSMEVHRNQLIQDLGSEKAADAVIERDHLLIQKYEEETPTKSKVRINPIIAQSYGLHQKVTSPLLPSKQSEGEGITKEKI